MFGLFVQPQRELQLNLKTKNTQNFQKIKLYGSPTTKSLKKPHSSRQVGGVEIEMGREAKRCSVAREVAAAQVVPHSCVVDKNWEGYLGNEQSQPQTSQPRVPVPGRLSSHNFWL